MAHPWLARFIDVAMAPLAATRQLVVPHARGRVLEVGCGTGLNFELYGDQVRALVALDPDPFMLARAAKRVDVLPCPVELLEAGAEEIPIHDASIDTALVTFAFCTIPDVDGALREIRRVLAPGGRLLFLEHTRSPRSAIAGVQRAATPLWRRLFGGCHLSRDPVGAIRRAGFTLDSVDPVGAVGWVPLPVYRGVARVA